MNEIYCPNCDCLMEAGSCCPDCGTQDYTEVDRETILVTFKIDPVYISMQNKKYYKDKYNIDIK